MKEELRIRVWNKYKKRCAYCGNPLLSFTGKHMQVDHKYPKSFAKVYKYPEPLRTERMKFYGLEGETIDDFKNLMPSCRRCNHYKRAEKLENFRETLKTIQNRLMDIYIFKVAVDYGVVNIKPFDGVFYFEKHNKEEI